MSSFQELTSKKYYQPPARGEPRLTTMPGSKVEYSLPAFLTEPVFWAVVGLPLFWIAIDLAFGETDRQKFERIEIGMTRAEVQEILKPKNGKRGHLHRDIPDDSAKEAFGRHFRGAKGDTH